MDVVIGILGLLVALAVLAYASFVFRRKVIARRGGTFDCSLRIRLTSAARAAGRAGGVDNANGGAAGNGEPAGNGPAGNGEPAVVEQANQDLGQGWTLGTARYAEDMLEWYRVFSFSPRPRWVFPRRELEVRGRRVPDGPEALALLSGAVVLECSWGERWVELAMADDALTGFLAWLESAPPGQHLDVA
jgi:Protein of unknown function (DUF2550)